MRCEGYSGPRSNKTVGTNQHMGQQRQMVVLCLPLREGKARTVSVDKITEKRQGHYLNLSETDRTDLLSASTTMKITLSNGAVRDSSSSSSSY